MRDANIDRDGIDWLRHDRDRFARIELQKARKGLLAFVLAGIFMMLLGAFALLAYIWVADVWGIWR